MSAEGSGSFGQEGRVTAFPHRWQAVLHVMLPLEEARLAAQQRRTGGPLPVASSPITVEHVACVGCGKDYPWLREVEAEEPCPGRFPQP